MVLGVRSRDVPGVAEDAAVRGWLQLVQDDLVQASGGAITLELEWRGWLDSPLGADALWRLEPAALAAHARTLTADPGAHGVVAIVNTACKVGAAGGDVVAAWITGGGQGGLRRCRFCGALHTAPNAALSHCWGSPEGTHVYDDSGTFELPRAAEGEVHFQNCSSCHAIWAFDGHSRGHCPKNPTGHTGGDRFTVARADHDADWAECTACQRVVSVTLADRGCIDSTEQEPVAHALAADRPLAVGHESFPTARFGTWALASVLGIHEDLAVTPQRGVRHPRFGERGPAPSAAAAWAAGWLPSTRVATITWKPPRPIEVVLGSREGTAPVLLEIDARGGVYAAEIDAMAPRPTLALRRYLGRGTRSVDGWRGCTACGAAVDSGALGCTAGGVHEFDDRELAVPLDRGYVRATPGWRRCLRCNGLWHEASGDDSVCPAGGPHRADAAHPYALRTSETATGFRACRRCRQLVDPALTTAPCPAGGAHDVRRSPFFSLDAVHRKAQTEPGWSICRKCGVVGSTASQHCAKTGGGHHLEDRDHAAERWRIVSGITATWRCIRCACMFGHAGVCIHGGPHRSAGMFPDHGLRAAAVIDRDVVPRGDEPPFPGGDGALLALRHTWRICRSCGVVFALGHDAACAATGAGHVGHGPPLVMSSSDLEGWRVLVGVGDTVAADRDELRLRITDTRGDDVVVTVEPT